MLRKYGFLYIVAGSVREAEKIGKKLVEEKLVACVNIFPIKSVYRWRGKIERAREVAMIVKTRRELIDRVINRVKKLHSYEVPAILAFNVEKGPPDFLKWIDESTK
jgi:periplasmic divalent cation tolerance protein